MWLAWLKALGVLSGTVMVHELAHALVARRVGGRVQEVGIGFGPRLLSHRAGETTLSLRPFLIGGFAAIDVEQLPPERRVPVLLAGPLANLLAGLLLLPRRLAPGALNAIISPQSPRVQLAGVVGAMSMLVRSGNLSALRFLAAQINLSVGLANLLPLMPLDGGHLALAKMEQRGVSQSGRDLFKHTTALLFLWLVLQVLFADLRRLGLIKLAGAVVGADSRNGKS